jgi:glutathione peroxidase
MAQGSKGNLMNFAMKRIAPLFFILCSTFSAFADTPQNQKPATSPDYLQYPLETITGDTVKLADYRGKVVLIVNVASKCGNTPQYAGLEALYKKYKGRGFVILGFPANNFKSQEPGSNKEILEFCQSNYNVTFPLMAKISVKDSLQHPLYAYLTKQSPFPGEITWNFNKFLLDQKGTVVARYESKVQPDDARLVEKIEALLGTKP